MCFMDIVTVVMLCTLKLLISTFKNVLIEELTKKKNRVKKYQNIEETDN